MIRLAALALLVGGCAAPPVETRVRRVETPAAIDELGRELGPEGWAIVAIVHDDPAYVVVLQRKAPR